MSVMMLVVELAVLFWFVQDAASMGFCEESFTDFSVKGSYLEICQKGERKHELLVFLQADGFEDADAMCYCYLKHDEFVNFGISSLTNSIQGAEFIVGNTTFDANTTDYVLFDNSIMTINFRKNTTEGIPKLCLLIVSGVRFSITCHAPSIKTTEVDTSSHTVTSTLSVFSKETSTQPGAESSTCDCTDNKNGEQLGGDQQLGYIVGIVCAFAAGVVLTLTIVIVLFRNRWNIHFCSIFDGNNKESPDVTNSPTGPDNGHVSHEYYNCNIDQMQHAKGSFAMGSMDPHFSEDSDPATIQVDVDSSANDNDVNYYTDLDRENMDQNNYEALQN